ncbi:MAG TPA: histidinol phosphate phosphatase domain-containing protein [Syntrophales bacterium]|nr:histidinol phosphate phosphatase domain-containing protein [Syntrophales bacterium]HON23182.1 histidinol phosphate phosphatase domain-containing protein [Syntrophales bacterium]HOU76528.1 histidinol phosphate phosphatase domain-containing protein [Syntrophales bacterium]HPC32449.1 histidinol phosphate phosphatase domain-containing protein [Syntrophales bacterium]HQG33842.1 histidinol phosphate phosphatase domain-containing protein [Syntrophales bacterium]
MIDLHTHSLFSDGELIPAELVRRAKVKGYRAIAVTDHGDGSNIDFIVPRIARVARSLGVANGLEVICGIELTHVPPGDIAPLAAEARALGARIVIVHGETIAEPVAPGTNRAALEAGVDILAHPGLITGEEVALAASRGIYLEVTTRRGHSLTNGHVVKTARQHGAPLVMNTDTHGPQDLVSREQAVLIARGAGMTNDEIAVMFANAESLLKKAGDIP